MYHQVTITDVADAIPNGLGLQRRVIHHLALNRRILQQARPANHAVILQTVSDHRLRQVRIRAYLQPPAVRGRRCTGGGRPRPA